MLFRQGIGRSRQGYVIEAFSNFGCRSAVPGPPVLIISGIHGDERAPVAMVQSFIGRYLHDDKRPGPLVVVPVANPDGWLACSRYTSSGVDLNRNFPLDWSRASEEPSGPAPLSEPESRALNDLIATVRPRAVVSLHCALSEIDADGSQSEGLAARMWECLGPHDQKRYRLRHVQPQERAPVCPGSLGQWCGRGLRLGPRMERPAMITLELPYTHTAPGALHPLPGNGFAILQEQWRADAAGYLRVIEPGVHAMLAEACRS